MSAPAIRIRLTPTEMTIYIKMENIVSNHKRALGVTECLLSAFDYESKEICIFNENILPLTSCSHHGNILLYIKQYLKNGHVSPTLTSPHDII